MCEASEKGPYAVKFEKAGQICYQLRETGQHQQRCVASGLGLGLRVQRGTFGRAHDVKCGKWPEQWVVSFGRLKNKVELQDVCLRDQEGEEGDQDQHQEGGGRDGD